MRHEALRKGLDDYITLRRRLGFHLDSVDRVLGQFVTFLERKRAPFITTELALQWARQPAKASPVWWSRRLGMVRKFAAYWHGVDPRTEVPPDKLLPRRRSPRRSPYICSDDEVSQFLDEAKRVTLRAELQARSYYTLFGLLAVSGMRMGEGVALGRDDVDLATGIITIRGAKFGKSRLVPVHDSTRRVLRRYATFRDRVFPQLHNDRFFVSENGRPLTRSAVDLAFLKLARKLGLDASTTRKKLTPHLLRHRFAVRTLVRWYRSGADVEQHLPKLSTYLGHTRVEHTYWYLSAVPELLRLATARVERRRRSS